MAYFFEKGGKKMGVGRTFQIAFAINAMLGSNFEGSFGTAQKKMQSLQETIKYAQNEQKRLNKVFDESKGKMSAAEYIEGTRRLGQEIDKTRAKQESLSRAMRNKQAAEGKFSNAKSGFTSALATATMMAAPIALSAATAANFEAMMSKVKAITGSTGEDFEKLTAKARELGRSTKYSATQSAEAMTFLGMAGWKTNEILSGMPGLLNLAAAGGTDLARTADIVSDVLTAMGMSADKSTHLADVFASTITTTNTNVEMLGDTMKYAAPVAHAFGATLEETAALAGIMANSGIKASQAGTALRSGFLRLAGPPKMASKAMEKLGMSMNDISAEQKEATLALESLGISMGDTAGPKKMSGILTELKNKTADLGKEEKLATLKAIFGTEAATGWLAVLESGPETFDKLVTQLEKSDGAAEKMAQVMNENAKGALITLKSASEDLGISIGNTLLPVLADQTNGLASIAAKASEWAQKHSTLTEIVIKAGLAFGAIVIVAKAINVAYEGYNLVKATTILLYEEESIAANAATLKTKALAIAQKAVAYAQRMMAGAQAAFNLALAACPIGWLLIGLAAIVVAGGILYKNWDKVKQFFTNLWENPTARILMFIAGPVGWLIGIVSAVIANWDTIKSYFEYFWENPQAAIFRFTSFLEEKFASTINWIKDKWDGLKTILNTPISVFLKGEGGEPKIAKNARGGIYNKGSFLTSFAEESDEAAIPLDGKPRSISLWQQAGKALGMTGGSSGSFVGNYSPQIYVSGNVGNEEIANLRQILEQQMNEFDSKIRAWQAQKARVAYD